MNALLSGLDGVLMKYKGAPSLNDANLQAIVGQSLSYISANMESAVNRKRFNQLGALLFDKELRLLVSYFSNYFKEGESVKDKIGAIIQVRMCVVSALLIFYCLIHLL